jgi:hypothetical protein
MYSSLLKWQSNCQVIQIVSALYLFFYQKNISTQKVMQKHTRLRGHHANTFRGILLYNSVVQGGIANH